MDGYLLQEIFNKDYADELMELIRSNGDVEDFLQNLEVKQRDHFLENDENIRDSRGVITENAKKVSVIDDQIAKLEKEKSLALEIQKRIDDIKKTYPPSKTSEVEKYFRNSLTSARERYKEALTSKPKGLIDRIRYGKSVDAGNIKLEELIAFCKEHNITELLGESGIIRDAVKGMPIDGKIKDIDTAIFQKQADRKYYSNNIETAERVIQRRIELYDNPDPEISSFAYQRKTQRQNVQQFTKDYHRAMTHPDMISQEQMLKSGLNEEYIERQIMESKYPEKNLRSIRRSYENLDRPAAPMVAFDREKLMPNGNLYTTEVADDIIEKLKQKGFDVVTEADPRAADPHVFVVDRKSKAIYAPFLSPEDALKANISMIDTIYECGGQAARSSPRTRETFAIATHSDLSGKGVSSRTTELDLETVASHYSKENYDRVMTDFSREFVEKSDYQTLHQMMAQLEKDNPEKYAELTKELREKALPYTSTGTWSQEAADKISHEFLADHTEDMMPYIKKSYQDVMLKEAFEKGIDPHIPNQENLLMMGQNRPIPSVFHAGQNGGLPFSILGKDKRMAHIYGATTLAAEELPETARKISGSTYTGGSLGYAFGNSSHDKKAYTTQKRFGFVYEYESRGDKQEITFLENFGGTEVSDFTDGKYDLRQISNIRDETAILPHQNKLKKIYIAIEDNEGGNISSRLFPLELDENGQIKDKRWRDFVELHNPVDDSLEGFMVDRQNNMIADYDKLGKEKMMDRHLNIKKVKEEPHLSANTESKSLKNETKTAQNITEEGGKISKVATEGAELAADTTVKIAAGKAAATTAKPKSGVLGTIKTVDDKINSSIDKTIEKGSEKLNNTKVGKMYSKAKKAISNSTVGKAVGNAAHKIGSNVTKAVKKTGSAIAQKFSGKSAAKAATKAVAKSTAKTVTKTAAKAVGKSILKKIPLVSIGAGLVFGAQRAMAGDWKGAAGEVASGALGTFPGVGTAASVAIDAGLAGRDIYNDMHPEGQQNPTAKQIQQSAKDGKTPVKRQMVTDAQNANNCAAQKIEQNKKQNSNKEKAPSHLKSSMKNDAKEVKNKYQRQMEALINSMNSSNGKDKAINAAETTTQLFQKYGENAYALLSEAVLKPNSFLNSFNDKNIKSSSDIVKHLCTMDNSPKNRQIVQNILKNRESSR